jgi:XTP/dITP diphosphohydrolase
MHDYPESGRLAGSPIVVASNNRHKIEEFGRILAPLGLRVIAPEDIGLSLQVDETGCSFAENASLKARSFLAASGLPTVADDSGLVVDALGGEPGIYSARYGGPGLNDAERNRLVLDRLGDVPENERGARFVCAIVLLTTRGRPLAVDGTVEGRISRDPRGRMGFGYDPIFYFPPAGKTFGEMSNAEKDAVSHRGRALRRLAAALEGPSGAGILR